MRFKERKIHSAGDLLTGLQEDQGRLTTAYSKKAAPLSNVPVWFRGLTKAEWSLDTTMAKKKNALQLEIPLMNRFKQNASQFLDHFPEEPWEWIFLMRHYGLPSRLLDWTESPLVGLFFAVTPVTGTTVDREALEDTDKVDGALWCLLPAELNDQAGFHSAGSNVIPMFEDPRADFNLYLPQDVSGPSAPTDVMPVAGIAKRGSKRMQAQHGVFTIHHQDHTPLDKFGDGNHIWRYVVPDTAKKPIREQLAMLGITALTVFPGLDNVARAAAEALGIDV